MDKIKNWKIVGDQRMRYGIARYAVLACIINLILETLEHQNYPGVGGIVFLCTHPVVFFYNALLIFATLSVCFLFRRRAFFATIVAGLWLAIGVTNGIILTQRMTPFTMKDLSNLSDGATILTNYISMKNIIIGGVVLVVVAIVLIALFFKGPRVEKGKFSIKKRIVVVLLIIGAAFGSTLGLIQMNVLSTFFGNLAYAYRDYGVAYCFINTWLNQGISKPSGYSQEAVEKVIKDSGISKSGTVKVTTSKVGEEEDSPNILFLQLESFVDPTLFNNIELSKDPIPNFRKLMKNYSSGSLTVPACGAGTANTEFEVMTGISVKFFGPGEYPFKSVLKDKSAESLAWDLKNAGYGTHAIHNHRALFYNRNEVFDNIGYDTFTSLEYMSDAEKTPKNWAKDKILTSQITDALKSTKSKDYIYTISVQGHGKYPSEEVLANPEIKVTKAPSTEAKNEYEYYVNQVHEMDQFIKKLTDTLSKYDEKVVLVLYGDHIPALDITEDTYDAKDLYQTQYVIWSNYDLEKKDKDIATYQLAADVLDRVGIHTGTIFQYHQNVSHKSDTYLSNLEMLAYDMLYGKDYTYGGKNPFTKAGMKMGVKEIKIDKVVNVGGKYYIKGKNFTEQSKITLDGKQLKTVYLGPSLLGLLEEVNPDDASKMKVSQIDKNNNSIISTTE